MWPAVNLILSVALFTLILIIQFVHYPSFKYYDEAQFAAGMHAHQQRISWIVIPLMLLEALAAVMLVKEFTTFAQLNLALVLAIWGVTFTMQVPLHRKLAQGKSCKAIEQLVRGNGWRVGIWGLKLAVAAKICEEWR